MFDVAASKRPGLGRYLACLVYESLLVIAWLFVLGALFLPFDVWLNPALPKGQLHVPAGGERIALWLWYGAGIWAYFIFFWVRGGQTLAMKTWKIRLVSLDGGKVRPLQATARLLVAAMGIPLLGLAWLWAFGSADRLWLHDQLSKTVLVKA